MRRRRRAGRWTSPWGDDPMQGRLVALGAATTMIPVLRASLWLYGRVRRQQGP